MIAQERHRLAVARGDIIMEGFRHARAPRGPFNEGIVLHHSQVVGEGIADKEVTRLRRTIEIHLHGAGKFLLNSPAVLHAGLAVGQDDRFHAGHGHAAFFRARASSER